MKTKRCRCCSGLKPLTEYYRHKRHKDGLQPWCKSCVRQHYKIKQRQNPELFRQRARDWLNKNPDRAKYLADRNQAKNLNLTIEQFREIKQKRDAGGVCSICSLIVEKFVIDHDHKTGNFRGLICGACNTLIGLFYEDLEVVQMAINYLQEADVSG